MQNELCLVFDANDEIYCVFFTMVVKIAALTEKYEGGLKGFLDNHYGFFNREILVLIKMCGCYLDDALEDLEKSGFVYAEDFVCLDLDTTLIFLEPDEQFDPGCNWLNAYYHQDGVMVSLIDPVEN